MRSGALNTATWATRLNRHLMAVPGPVTQAQSEGVHQLLRSGAASLVTHGAEVLEVVGDMGTHLATPPRAPGRSRDRMGRRDQRILDAVPLAQPARVDSIAVTAGLDLVAVQSGLNSLRKVGLVELLPQGWRTHARGSGLTASARRERRAGPSGRRSRPRVTSMASPTRDLPVVLADYERHLVLRA